MHQSIQDMLKVKIWAVIGATDNKEKYGYKIFKLMREAGYEVYPVNPGVSEVLGQPCYPSVKDLPVKPEAADIVVPPRIGEQIVKECAELGIGSIWLQPGADADNVVELAEKLNLRVVHNACIMAEIRKRGGIANG